MNYSGRPLFAVFLWVFSAVLAAPGSAQAVTASDTNTAKTPKTGTAATGPQGSEQLVDGIAAQVGSRIVLVSEVLRSVQAQEAALRKAGGGESDVAKLRADALEHLIEERLVEGVVAKLEVNVTDAEIDKTIHQIAEMNGLTLEQLYASVVFHGMSREEYRKQIKKDLERRNVVNSLLAPDVKLDESDVRALYDQQFGSQPERANVIRVRQILISFGKDSARTADQACATAGEARKRVVERGESFEAVAKELSEVAPKDGGDLGWLPVDQLAGWMREALDPVKAGGVSEIVVQPFGCSVLQVVERREMEKPSYEKVHDALREEAFNHKLEERYRKWIEELRGKTYIDRRGYFAEASTLKVKLPSEEDGAPSPVKP
jgi:peptidyl-prolyl cis-trans isomerase SurA